MSNETGKGETPCCERCGAMMEPQQFEGKTIGWGCNPCWEDWDLEALPADLKLALSEIERKLEIA